MNLLRPILPTDIFAAAFGLSVWFVLVYRCTMAVR